MATPSGDTGIQRRRSQRVMLRLPVLVHGTSADGKPFHEHTYTLVVNAHGALLHLVARVAIRQTVMLANVSTEQGCECRVVYLGIREEGKTQVGVEFVTPNPHFWNVEFPPSDWKPFA
jgi:c-di-GMP-binding flagellar brake protein YcgR